MKKQFTLFCMALIAVAPICFGQASPSKSDRSATKEAAITDSEKSAWEAYKNKQADAFKKYLATDYCGVYAEGIKNVDKEVAGMEQTELRDYSFADMKVVFPSSDVAVTTYKATLQSNTGGQDTSGTYNVASVWIMTPRVSNVARCIGANGERGIVADPAPNLAGKLLVA